MIQTMMIFLSVVLSMIPRNNEILYNRGKGENKMKKLILLLVFLVSCGRSVVSVDTPTPEPTQTPEIIYVEITATLETKTYLTDPEFYFGSWEAAKKIGVTGMYFWLGGEDTLIFASDEASALHEIGHLADRSNGYPSYFVDFQAAVDEYINNPPADVQDELHRYLFVVIVERGGMYDDAYAQLYMWDILYDLPVEFKEFYGEVITTPEPTPRTPTVGCEYYFKTWKSFKETGTTGLNFKLGDNEALIFFTTEEAGLHEVGHFVDYSNNDISSTPEFITAVKTYLASNAKDENLYDFIFSQYIKNEYNEVFAILYMYNFIGDYPLPEVFEEFYVR